MQDDSPSCDKDFNGYLPYWSQNNNRMVRSNFGVDFTESFRKKSCDAYRALERRNSGYNEENAVDGDVYEAFKSNPLPLCKRYTVLRTRLAEDKVLNERAKKKDWELADEEWLYVEEYMLATEENPIRPPQNSPNVRDLVIVVENGRKIIFHQQSILDASYETFHHVDSWILAHTIFACEYLLVFTKLGDLDLFKIESEGPIKFLSRTSRVLELHLHQEPTRPMEEGNMVTGGRYLAISLNDKAAVYEMDYTHTVPRMVLKSAGTIDGSLSGVDKQGRLWVHNDEDESVYGRLDICGKENNTDLNTPYTSLYSWQLARSLASSIISLVDLIHDSDGMLVLGHQPFTIAVRESRLIYTNIEMPRALERSYFDRGISTLYLADCRELYRLDMNSLSVVRLGNSLERDENYNPWYVDRHHTPKEIVKPWRTYYTVSINAQARLHVDDSADEYLQVLALSDSRLESLDEAVHLKAVPCAVAPEILNWHPKRLIWVDRIALLLIAGSSQTLALSYLDTREPRESAGEVVKANMISETETIAAGVIGSGPRFLLLIGSNEVLAISAQSLRVISRISLPGTVSSASVDDSCAAVIIDDGRLLLKIDEALQWITVATNIESRSVATVLRGSNCILMTSGPRSMEDIEGGVHMRNDGPVADVNCRVIDVVWASGSNQPPVEIRSDHTVRILRRTDEYTKTLPGPIECVGYLIDSATSRREAAVLLSGGELWVVSGQHHIVPVLLPAYRGTIFKACVMRNVIITITDSGMNTYVSRSGHWMPTPRVGTDLPNDAHTDNSLLIQHQDLLFVLQPDRCLTALDTITLHSIPVREGPTCPHSAAVWTRMHKDYLFISNREGLSRFEVRRQRGCVDLINFRLMSSKGQGIIAASESRVFYFSKYWLYEFVVDNDDFSIGRKVDLRDVITFKGDLDAARLIHLWRNYIVLYTEHDAGYVIELRSDCPEGAVQSRHFKTWGGLSAINGVQDGIAYVLITGLITRLIKVDTRETEPFPEIYELLTERFKGIWSRPSPQCANCVQIFGRTMSRGVAERHVALRCYPCPYHPNAIPCKEAD